MINPSLITKTVDPIYNYKPVEYIEDNYTIPGMVSYADPNNLNLSFIESEVDDVLAESKKIKKPKSEKLPSFPGFPLAALALLGLLALLFNKDDIQDLIDPDVDEVKPGIKFYSLRKFNVNSIELFAKNKLGEDLYKRYVAEANESVNNISVYLGGGNPEKLAAIAPYNPPETTLPTVIPDVAPQTPPERPPVSGPLGSAGNPIIDTKENLAKGLYGYHISQEVFTVTTQSGISNYANIGYSIFNVNSVDTFVFIGRDGKKYTPGYIPYELEEKIRSNWRRGPMQAEFGDQFAKIDNFNKAKLNTPNTPITPVSQPPTPKKINKYEFVYRDSVSGKLVDYTGDYFNWNIVNKTDAGVAGDAGGAGATDEAATQKSGAGGAGGAGSGPPCLNEYYKKILKIRRDFVVDVNNAVGKKDKIKSAEEKYAWGNSMALYILLKCLKVKITTTTPIAVLVSGAPIGLIPPGLTLGASIDPVGLAPGILPKPIPDIVDIDLSPPLFKVT